MNKNKIQITCARAHVLKKLVRPSFMGTNILAVSNMPKYEARYIKMH